MCPVLHDWWSDRVCWKWGTDGWKGYPDLPLILLMVLHALRLECEKSWEFAVSSHRSCLFRSGRESRDEAALSESVPTGARRNERVLTVRVYPIFRVETRVCCLGHAMYSKQDSSPDRTSETFCAHTLFMLPPWQLLHGQSLSCRPVKLVPYLRLLNTCLLACAHFCAH